MFENNLSYKNIMDDLKLIYKHLERLVKTPGPLRCVAKLSDNFDPRLDENNDFFMYKIIKEIVQEFNKKLKTSKIFLKQHNGNIIIIGGFTEEPSDSQIKDIPIILASHADEITFLITKKTKKKSNTLFREVKPMCSTKALEDEIWHDQVKVYGFRNTKNGREFIEIGEENNIHWEIDKEKKYRYYIKENEHYKEGDVVIQDYFIIDNDLNNDNLENKIFQCKALDDRVGVLCHLYTIYYLSKFTNIKSKAIFNGDEEGIPVDVSWSRLINPTFDQFCNKNDVIIICDGIDGKNLKEIAKKRAESYSSKDNINLGNYHINEALIIPYTGDCKGGGDHGLFSYIRDFISENQEFSESNFRAMTCTDYVSRSLDPKIMNKYPLICFINWSNGYPLFSDEDQEIPIKELSKAQRYASICHLDESVSLEQVCNIIGTTYYIYKDLYMKIKNQ
ncbi:MAG: hypothetical protein ACTSRP_19205 [Candidatus Helarchaeota archaeon]